MGHRREVFKPRKGRKHIESQINQELDKKNFDGVVQTALSHYLTKSSVDTFTLALVATVEAINVARDLNWSRTTEELADIGITLAESKTRIKLTTFNKQIVFNLISKSLQKERAKEESL